MSGFVVSVFAVQQLVSLLKSSVNSLALAAASPPRRRGDYFYGLLVEVKRGPNYSFPELNLTNSRPFPCIYYEARQSIDCELLSTNPSLAAIELSESKYLSIEHTIKFEYFMAFFLLDVAQFL